MKRILLMLTIILILTSCQLADSGRMASLQIKYSKPDILNSSIHQNSNEERAIFADSGHIEIYLFKELQPLFMTEYNLGDPLDTDNLQAIIDQEHLFYTLDLSGKSQMDFSLAGIEPGTWHIMIVSFEANATWADNYTSGSLLTDRELSPGVNLVEASLIYNSNEFSNIIAGDGSDSFNLTPSNLSHGTSIYSITSSTVNIFTEFDFAYIISIRAYDKEGYLIYSTNPLSDGEPILDFSVEGNDTIFLELILSPSHGEDVLVDISTVVPGETLNITIFVTPTAQT